MFTSVEKSFGVFIPKETLLAYGAQQELIHNSVYILLLLIFGNCNSRGGRCKYI